MDHSERNKRLKSSSGRPISTSNSGASNLPAYQPPQQIIGGARGGSGPGSSRPSASIARPANGAGSLRLTVKAPPSKLRQATSGGSIPPNPYADQSESDDTPAPAPRTARATRNPRTVIDPESDEDEDEDEDEDADGEDLDEDDVNGQLDQQLLGNEDSEEDADGEDDEDMDDHPTPPVIKQQRGTASVRSNITVAPPPSKALKSVEAKEMEDDDDDEELSELESNDDLGNDQDEDNDDEEEDSGSAEDDENSRSATPDLTKLTKRQRAAFEEDPSLMALSNEALKKKHLTDEEHVQRRAEMARRRKNLSEKRNEEEKMETINKLLQKQAPKRRTRAEIAAANAAEHSGEEDEEGRPKPNSLYVRWVSNKDGSRVGVPEEWLHAPVGDVFRRPGGGRLIEEVA
ncbi:hypothetical protein TI39_contig4154g00009 [Zymoseptoria brevis]|uniref:INO80 complex subunit B-like conserved region domain-containing protein n=1 Tax=Zymoseptoria brevis TaxID=1047168 RepID=A0A0F4GBX4_9PEZI|nr:hypothetical protein TI39_contig4154g00009 [Zymoseptoria brevis]